MRNDADKVAFGHGRVAPGDIARGGPGAVVGLHHRGRASAADFSERGDDVKIGSTTA